LYLISLLFLTNFKLGEWLRALWPPGRGRGPEKDWTQEEKPGPARQELERQAQKLQEQAEKSGLGADLKPCPRLRCAT